MYVRFSQWSHDGRTGILRTSCKNFVIIVRETFYSPTILQSPCGYSNAFGIVKLCYGSRPFSTHHSRNDRKIYCIVRKSDVSYWGRASRDADSRRGDPISSRKPDLINAWGSPYWQGEHIGHKEVAPILAKIGSWQRTNPQFLQRIPSAILTEAARIN